MCEYQLKHLHPKIQQFVLDIDAIYVKLWTCFQNRHQRPDKPIPSETFPNSLFLQLFERCHVMLANELVLYKTNPIPFPCTISFHEFMNGVECKVSVLPHDWHRIAPYKSEEMLPIVATMVSRKWFRNEPLIFYLQWENVSFWDRYVWHRRRSPEIGWCMINQVKEQQEFQLLLRYFFRDDFRFNKQESEPQWMLVQSQWFLAKSRLDECLDLFTFMHVRLPNSQLLPFLQNHLITDLCNICLAYL